MISFFSFFKLSFYSGGTQFAKKPSDSYKKMWAHVTQICSLPLSTKGCFVLCICLTFVLSFPQSPPHCEVTYREPGGPAEQRGAGETVRLTSLRETAPKVNMRTFSEMGFHLHHYKLFTERRQQATFWEKVQPDNGLMCSLLLRNLSMYDPFNLNAQLAFGVIS